MSTAEFIQPSWQAPASVAAQVTTRRLTGRSLPPFDRFNLGMHCGDEPGVVATNRERLIELAGLPNPPHWLAQVHGAQVHRIERAQPDEVTVQADAAVTAVIGAVVAILTADCLPVLLCARDGSEVGAAHAGWRGLANGVLEATVAAMGAPPEELLAWLGPAAGPTRYEIGEEVYAAFVDRDAHDAACFRPTQPGHWLVDLCALARRRLVSAGVNVISGGDLCTISDASRFYSHRRDGRSGRMASLIWLRQA